MLTSRIETSSVCKCNFKLAHLLSKKEETYYMKIKKKNMQGNKYSQKSYSFEIQFLRLSSTGGRNALNFLCFCPKNKLLQ